MQGKKLSLIMLGLWCLVQPTFSLKAEKKNSPKIVKPSEITKVEVTFTVGKKNYHQEISCYKKTPGQTKKVKKGVIFTSFSSLLKEATKAKKKTKSSYLKAIAKAGKLECAREQRNNPPDGNTPGGNTPGGNDTPENNNPTTNTPSSSLLLVPYKGEFGEKEARILFNRFSFGATPERIQQAVQEGLGKTVTALLTYSAEPGLDEMEKDLQCDGRLSSDPENSPCDPSDPNDLYFPGFRYALYQKFWYSQNGFFHKLFMFLHDERLGVSTNALPWCQNHAVKDYLELTRRGAITGDYKQYMRDWNSDLFGHLQWLDGGSNRGDSPNENYAREFWELGTVGPTDRKGTPVYTNADIAQSALAFSGWSIQGYEHNEHWICYGAYVPAFHASGPKTIFAGTPYQATVFTAEDVLQATFSHPRTAESLAEDIWKEFISPSASDDDIRALADEIRKNDYHLLPVFSMIMQSQALFDLKNRNSLIKHPVELIIGFLKTTRFPLEYYFIDEWLGDMGQRPLFVPTVFGWNEKKLAGESYVLEWRNAAMAMLTWWDDAWTKKGYSFQSTFLEGLAGSPNPARACIERITGWMNIDLNEAQKAKLEEYLNYTYRTCSNPARCGGNSFELRRDAFDPHPDNTDASEYKLRGLLAILATLPDYRMK